ncbi:MAG: OsmC family protein [Gammaproteobacteria bacterium]|nr:OsmC family protein [Gammaproteobacteria bacterium]
MQEFPHSYDVSASGSASGTITLTAANMPALQSAPPEQFGGPGDQWSPEHLLTAAVADCFILTFRAVAQASKLEWTQLDVTAQGTLDRVERTMKFTAFNVTATLTVPSDTDPAKAERVMEKSEAACMITNSLSAETHLHAKVIQV